MTEEKNDSVITRGQSLLLTSSAGVGALTTFIFTWWASRILPIQENKDFLIFWSLISVVFASLIGIQQESTRLVSTHQAQAPTRAQQMATRTVRPPLIAFAAGVTVALIFILLTPVWLSQVLPPHDATASILIIVIATLAYGVHAYFIGASAGLKAWTEYSLLIATGGVFCLFLAFVTSFFTASKILFELSFAATAFLWTIFLVFSPKVREAAYLQVPGKARTMYTRMLWAIATSLAVAIMSVGFPLLLETTSQGDVAGGDAFLAALILAISITRAPIMLPLQAFQGVAVSHFLAQKGSPFKSLIKPSLALVALGALGGILAYLLAPWLFDMIYPKYAGNLSNSSFALLTFAAGLLAITTLSGTAALALDAHPVYLSGWVITVIVSFGLLFMPLDLEFRAITALLAGPIAGFIVHALGMEYVARQRGLREDEPIFSAANTHAKGE